MRARRPTATLRARARAFSLLEVMVAIAILGLAITVILSAQGGLAASNKSAANMGEAITVGRCRMTEIEEKLLKFGYQELDEVDSSTTCCDDKEIPGYSCEWRVEKVVLPNPAGSTGDGGFSPMAGMLGGDGGMSIPGLGGAGGLPGLPGMPGMTPGQMTNPAGGAGLDFDAGLANIGNGLMQQFGGVGGASGMLSMVFSIVYPSLKPVLEMSIRRITVTIKWKEGLKDRELPLVQYVTNPQRAGFAAGFGGDGGFLPDGGIAPTPTGGGILPGQQGAPGPPPSLVGPGGAPGQRTF